MKIHSGNMLLDIPPHLTNTHRTHYSIIEMQARHTISRAMNLIVKVQ